MLLLGRLLSLFTAFLLVGCSLKAKSEGSKLSLVVANPHAQLASGGSSVPHEVAPTAWNSTEFKCYGVNVVGPGIADKSKNPKSTSEVSALFAGSSSCAYRGVLSNAFSFTAASGEVTVDLQVPPGAGRVIQLVGITNAAYCTSNFFEGDNTASPGIYELGRATTDLYGDTTISLPITYAATESRRVDCGGASASPSTVNLVTFNIPANNAVTASMASAVTLGGTCSEIGQNVLITSPVSGFTNQNVQCVGAGTWSYIASLSAIADGTFDITATHTSATAGVTIPPAIHSFTKDTIAPTVSISNPAPSTVVNAAGAAAFTIYGTCSDNGQTVVITPSSGSPVNSPCGATSWTKTFDISSIPDGNFTISVQESDAAGNASAVSTRNFIKSTAVPTVAITSPAAGSYIGATNVSSFAVSGTCSVNGAVVNLSGSAPGSTMCSAGAWSANLNFTSAAQGAATLNADLTDLNGNVATTSSRAFVKDTVIPTVALTTFVSGQVVTAGTISNIQWTASDLSPMTFNIEYSTDGGGTYTTIATGAPDTGSFAWTVPSTPTSTMRMRLAAVDSAGNYTVVFSTPFNTIIGAPSQLAITGPTPAVIGVCMGPYTLAVQDANATAVNAASFINVTVTHPSGTIYPGPLCNDGGGTAIPITSGSPAGVFFFLSDQTSGAVAFTASSTPSMAMLPSSVAVNAAWSGGLVSPAGINSRHGQTTVDTGSGFLTWGGLDDGNVQVATGFKFDSSANSVSAISAVSAPSARSSHTAVWTGTKMIIWGGYYGGPLNSGGIYDFASNTWTAMSTSGAPAARYNHTAVWTGTKMIVWGGKGSSTEVDDGGVFDPATNSWSSPTGLSANANRPSARMNAVGVWLSTKFFVWGGSSNSQATTYDTGALYDPTGDTWTAVSPTGAPTARENASVVTASGNAAIIWGGYSAGTSYVNTGATFNVSTGTWGAATATTGAPLGRAFHSAVWTGSKMLIWGGTTSGSATNTGAIYDPSANSWTTMSTISAPVARLYQTSYFNPTSKKFYVWGGQGVSSSAVDTLQVFRAP